MKILLTGPRGFIATRLLEHLSGYEVRTLDRDFPMEELPRFFIEEKFEVVIHLATLFLKSHSYEQIDALVDSNLTLTSRLLECAHQSGVSHLIAFGTYYEFPAPASLYAATKAAMAPILEYYAGLGRTRVTELYLYDTYGPRDPRAKILNLLIQAAISGQQLELSPGLQKMKLLHVDDVCRAILQTVKSFPPDTKNDVARYAVEPLEAPTLREVAQKIETVTGRKLNAKWGARAYTPGVSLEPSLPFAPLSGWQAQISLQQGLVEVVKSC